MSFRQPLPLPRGRRNHPPPHRALPASDVFAEERAAGGAASASVIGRRISGMLSGYPRILWKGPPMRLLTGRVIRLIDELTESAFGGSQMFKEGLSGLQKRSFGCGRPFFYPGSALFLSVFFISLFPPAAALDYRPSASEPLSKIEEPAWAWGSEAGVFVAGKKLFIPLGYPGLAIYDISDPRTPVFLSRLNHQELRGQAGAVAAQGNRAYVATPDQKTIALLDITDPSKPFFLANFGYIPYIQHLEIRDRYLYACAASSIGQNGGVYAFDISTDPPTAVGSYLTDLIDPGFHVTASGIVFLARTPRSGNDSAKIDCLDMSKPATPVFLGQWASDYPGNIVDISESGDKIYCAAYWGGIWVLDMSDPANLKRVSMFDWAEGKPYAKSVQAHSDQIYIAQGGPSLSYQKFDVFEFGADQIELVEEIPAAAYTQSVRLADDLLLLIEIESPWETPTPRKILHLYKTPLRLKPRPPLDVALQRLINRSLFLRETINRIAWKPNPDNESFDITEYRIYRKFPGEGDQYYQLIGGVKAGVLEFLDRFLGAHDKYAYAVTAVESGGLESLRSPSVEN